MIDNGNYLSREHRIWCESSIEYNAIVSLPPGEYSRLRAVEAIKDLINAPDTKWLQIIHDGNLPDIALYATVMDLDSHLCGQPKSQYDMCRMVDEYVGTICEHLDFTGLDYVRDVFERVNNLAAWYAFHTDCAIDDSEEINMILCRAIPDDAEVPGYDFRLDGIAYNDYQSWVKAVDLKSRAEFAEVLAYQSQLCLDALGMCYTRLQIREINREHGGGIPRYFCPLIPDVSDFVIYDDGSHETLSV